MKNNNRYVALIGAAFMVLFILVVIFVQRGSGGVQPPTVEASADPQMLLIPRWFIDRLTLDGQEIAVMPDQQAVTLQFKPDGTANGSGGCNDFFVNYQASTDGSMKFGAVAATKMACADGMQLETAYFNALAKVERFQVEAGHLRLFSVDGKSEIILRMPPK